MWSMMLSLHGKKEGLKMSTPVLLLVLALVLQHSEAQHHKSVSKDFPYNWQEPQGKTFSCLKGWEGRGTKCYKVFSLPATRDGAQHICSSMGSTLVNIEDVIENIFVGSQVETTDSHIKSWWTGFKTTGLGPEATWSNGEATTVNVVAWDVDQPHRAAHPLCAHASKKELYPWSLASCYDRLPFVCAREKCLAGNAACRNKGCVPTSALCDGENDCGDASDESDCVSASYCTKTVQADTGDMTFPAAGDQKDAAEYYCTLYLEGAPGSKIVTTFKTLSPDVNHMNIFCGGSVLDSAKLVDTVLGDDLAAAGRPDKYVCPDHLMIIQVAGNAPTDRDLLSLSWEMAPVEVNDGVRHVTSVRTLLSSPFYSSAQHYGHLNARWILQTDPYQILTIQFEELNLARGEQLKIYDGQSPQGALLTSLNFRSKLGARNSPHVVMTSGHQAYLELSSGLVTPGGTFKLYHHAGCNAELTASHGVIMSPGMIMSPAPAGAPYPPAITCTWTIRPSTPGRLITLQFSPHFDIDSSDILQVGSTDVSAHQNFTSHGPVSVYFRVTPRETNAHTGFMATFSMGCENLTVNAMINGAQPAAWENTLDVSCAPDDFFTSMRYAGHSSTGVPITCMMGGEWDSDPSLLECKKRTCGEPTPIANGFVESTTSVMVAGEASYRCFPGFTISSAQTALCTKDGWTRLPNCGEVLCPKLALPVNGNITYDNGNDNNTITGTRATFVCDPGYDLIGDEIVYCNVSGYWSGNLDPVCQPLTCLVELVQQIPDLQIISKVPATVPLDSNLTIQCDEGYMLNGPSVLICRPDQRFFAPGNASSCDDINECQEGSDKCEQVCQNTEGSYTCSCNYGFELTPDRHTCIAQDLCSILSPCEGSCTNGQGTYTCDCPAPGKQLYDSVGLNGVHPSDGETGLLPWNLPAVNHSCVDRICPTVNLTIPNGRLMTRYGAYFYQGQTAIYRCDLGYVISQSPTVVKEASIMCHENGTLSQEPPTCTEAVCAVADTSSNLFLSANASGTVMYGQQVVYSCSVPGRDTITFTHSCQYHFTDDTYILMGEPVVCERIDCGIPQVAEDKLVGINSTCLPGGGSTFFDDTFEFTCDTNSTLVGNSSLGNATVPCENNGFWGLGDLRCLARSCVDPGYPAGGAQVDVTSYEANQFVGFRCYQSGYYPEPARIQCIFMVDGAVNWNDTNSPVCKDGEDPQFPNCAGGSRELVIRAAQSPSDAASVPIVTDNTGVQQVSSDVNIHAAIFSDTNVTWTARDFQGNTATCVWVVKIQNLRPLTLDCPANVSYTMANYTDTTVLDLTTWITTTTSDPTALLSFSPPSLQLSEQVANSGFVVDITATDTFNNTAKCRTVVNIDVPTCGPWALVGHKNGQPNCTYTANVQSSGRPGYECLPYCDAGYVFFTDHEPSVYSCQIGGSFSPSAVVPSCVVPQRAEYNRVMTLTFAHNLVSGCLNTVKDYFTTVLNNDVIGHAQDGYLTQCLATFDNVAVSMNGSVDVTSKSSSSIEVRFTITLVSEVKYALTVCGNKITNDFDLIATPFAKAQAKTYLAEASATNIDTASCGGCIGGGCTPAITYTANSFVDDTPNTPDTNPKYGFFCPSNLIMQQIADGGYDCASCPPGYYTVNETCVECPAGTYQNQSAQASCLPCPQGTNSPFTANSHEERCFLTCPPGFISTGEGAEGLSPCVPCGANKFWVDSTSCASCPANHITLNPILGSPDNSFCKAPCPEGYFSDTGYQPDCAACPLGFYGTQNMTTCEACAAGNATTLATGALNDTLCTETCSAACTNGGNCVIMNNSHECECAPGYTGALCETQLNPCDSGPCYNNGNCTALDGLTYECACTSTSTEVMKLVQLNSDYINSLVNSLNIGTLEECKSHCLADATCQAISFNPSPPVTVPAKYPCDIFSSSTGATGAQPGYTLYKKTSAVAHYYNGTRCEHDPIDECAQTVCQNGGQCRDMPGYAECLCSTVDIFSGEFCQEAKEECQKEPCQNGATCLATSTIRRLCLCPPGYTGRSCETLMDMCVPDPCLHSATCGSSVPGSYTCACPAGFGGPLCMDRTAADPCLSMPCVNGRCVLSYQNNTATCVCDEKFTYNSTSNECVPDDACMPNPCLQGGHCKHVGLTDFNCTCPRGYDGSVCQHDVDDCLAIPCQNGGSCRRDGIGGDFTCNCTDRWAGELCTDRINLCEPVCFNGNLIRLKDQGEGEYDYDCLCLPGYTGDECETTIDDCDPQPCLHGGTCTDLDVDFRCDCAPGWEGKMCEELVGLCTEDTCSNGAPCYNVSRLSFCDCQHGTFGDQCENSPSTCANANPCLNNGTCVEARGRLMCNCTMGYDGQWCEKDTDFCAHPSPCQNDGKCHQLPQDYKCECPHGFTGNDCEVNVDDCGGVNCENGGVPRDGVGACDCFCPSGFVGPRCGTVLPGDYIIDFYGSSKGESHAFPISQQFFTFSLFVKYATPGATGTFACLYGLTSADEPVSEGEEIGCLADGSGNNDGQEHFMAVLWQGGATAELHLDSIIDTVNVNMKPTFTHAILVVGSKPNSQFLGELRDINLWNLFLKANISRISDGQDMSEFNPQHAVDKEPPHLTGAARLLVGFQPTPTTKVFPALLPNGCPADMAVTAGSQLSVVATFPEPRFNPTTFTTTTSNYASGLPRSVGIFDIQTVAEKGDAYDSCAFNLYVRYGSCENPPAPLGGGSPTCDGTSLHQGCNAGCPLGRAFLNPAPQLFTCGSLGVFGRKQPRQPFSFPACGELHPSTPHDVTLTVHYTIRNEKQGATSTPVTSAVTRIVTAAVRHANNVTVQNGGTPMCEGPCDVTISAVNTADELTSATITLANVSMVVGPGGNWALEHFLRQQILQDGIFDGTAKPGQSGFTLPATGLRDISGTLGFSVSVSPNCPPLYQAVGAHCVKCTGGTYYNSSLSRCEPCAVGFYNELDGQMSCSPCGVMRTTLSVGASNSTDCVDICHPGTHFNLTDNICVDCGRGFYQPDSGQSLCRPCDVGQTTTVYNATSIDDCVAQCVAGQYLNLENQCSLCRAGLYRRLEDKTCQQCPGSTTTPMKGATAPEDCTIRLCAAGQKNVNNTCTPCATGTYSTTRDATECAVCGHGNSTTGPGSSAPDACMLYCGNGTFVNVSTSRCEPCPPNTYLGGSHSEGFSESCTTCPNGLRTEGHGKMVLSECKIPVCSRGEIVNPVFVEDPQRIGGVPCLACNESSYQPFNDPINRTCLMCPHLYVTLSTGATSNASCVPMKISRLSATIKLETTCDPSFLLPSSQQRIDLVSSMADPTQSDSLVNQVKQSLGANGDNVVGIDIKGLECGSIRVNFDILYVRQSDAGQTVTDQQVVQAVEAIATRQDVIAGLPAIPNTVVVVPKNTVACHPGEGLNTTSGVGVCEVCPVGTFQFSDIKETCLPCASGYTTSGSGQVWDFVNQPAQDPCRKICPAGQASADNVFCGPCPIGEFKTTEGIGACTSCGPNTITLQIGATSPVLCLASCDPGFFSTTNRTTGLKECQVCPHGSYSQYRNSLTCIQCRPMYTTKTEGKTSPADCLNVCLVGGYCLNGATCRFDEFEQKPHCDCKIPYEGDMCQTRGVPPAITPTTLIIVAVLAGVGGIMLIAMVIFGTCVLIKRRKGKEPRKSMGSPYPMKEPIVAQGIYHGEDPVYSTSIAPTYYPMGVSFSRRYPVIPDATSRGVSSMHAALPIPRPAMIMPRQRAVLAPPAMMAVPEAPRSQYMFYEDRDEVAYDDMPAYASQAQVFRRGGPQMYHAKTAYFE